MKAKYEGNENKALSMCPKICTMFLFLHDVF